MIKQPLTYCLAATALLLAACSNNDDDFYATPGGLYAGTLSASSLQDSTYAIIDESGFGRMIDSTSGDYYRLSLSNKDLSLSGTYQEYPASGDAAVSGDFSGRLTDQGMKGSFIVSGSTVSSLSALFDNNYFYRSNLNLLVGNWSYSASGDSFSVSLGINSDGSFTGSDSSGCDYAGAFSVFDSDFNAYHVSYTLTCGITHSSYSGVAAYYYADSQYPAGIELMADDSNGNYLAVQVLSAPATAAAAQVAAPASAKGSPARPAPAVLRHTAAG